MQKPNFFAVIPATVRYCNKLPPSAKLLYAEISALASTDLGCIAANSYFAELFNVDTRTIRRWMNLLEEQNFIQREKLTSDRTRRIYISLDAPKKNKLESYQEILDGCAVPKELQSFYWQFIKHCQLNGKTLTNDKLYNIIIRLDMHYRSDVTGKMQSLLNAINKGYFDIAED